MAASTYDVFARVRIVQNFFLCLYARASRTTVGVLDTRVLSEKKCFAAPLPVWSGVWRLSAFPRVCAAMAKGPLRARHVFDLAWRFAFGRRCPFLSAFRGMPGGAGRRGMRA